MFKKTLCIGLLLCLASQPVYADEVILGGDSVGIMMEYDGVLISGTYNVKHENIVYNPINDDIQKGDLIQAVNGKPIRSIEELSQAIYGVNESSVTLTLMRNSQLIERELDIYYVNSQIRSGLFVKDEILGIGTLTFIDPLTKRFAALGHEIIDSDTKKMVPLNQGAIYGSLVVGLRKSANNSAGEKQAEINFAEVFGRIHKNTVFGIYGNVHQLEDSDLIETASQSEITLGKAQMYTVLQGDQVEAIDIEIISINKQNQPSIKSFEFRIVDEACLSKTNGIIQGMSGSPIVQNNKLIGAVTHVILNKPHNGYGVFIEWMLLENKAT